MTYIHLHINIIPKYIYAYSLFRIMDTGILGKVVAISIGLFVAAIILPTALVTMAGANVSGVDPAVVTILQVLLPVLAVIAVAMYFLRD
jgi:hypothetical protein